MFHTIFFFFSSRRRHTRCSRDWSSDVCSSDLNVQRLGGLLLSEAVMLKLGETLGRNAAHDLVYEAAMTAFDGKGSFRELLLADPRIAAVLPRDELDRLLDPAAYTGLAGPFVDRVVREARRLNR